MSALALVVGDHDFPSRLAPPWQPGMLEVRREEGLRKGFQVILLNVQCKNCGKLHSWETSPEMVRKYVQQGFFCTCGGITPVTAVLDVNNEATYLHAVGSTDVPTLKESP